MAIVFTPGLCLSERYRLERPVGSGGMSQIWLARDEVLGRPVAVKALRGSRLADPALLDAVHREARAAANISHPHVTQVYDLGETNLPESDGTVPYLVMELLEGEDLAKRLAVGPIEWPDAVRLAAEVAGALDAAHAIGIVHGDIKPANVMLTAAGAKVIDFGIASWDADPDATGPRAGTPAFLAPEVLAGGVPTFAADVYGLGALLYAALTGRRPVEAGTWEEAAEAHADGESPAPLSVVGLPPAVAELCTQCLNPVPEARPSAAAAAQVLRASLRFPLPAPVRPEGASPVRWPTAVGSASVPTPTLGLPSGPAMFEVVSQRRWTPAVLAAAVIVLGCMLIAAAAFGSATVTPAPVVAPGDATDQPAATNNAGPTDQHHGGPENATHDNTTQDNAIRGDDANGNDANSNDARSGKSEDAKSEDAKSEDAKSGAAKEDADESRGSAGVRDVPALKRIPRDVCLSRACRTSRSE